MTDAGTPGEGSFLSIQPKGGFSVVGITASPTKLEALQQFLQHMTPTSGLAFIVTQHGSGKNKIFPLELLSKYTAMNMFHVHDNMSIQPNCIYLMPPQKDMAIRSGKIFLTDYGYIPGFTMPADRFMYALAESFGSKTIIILLIGGNIDGARGTEAIKRVHGMVMAEAKNSSKPILIGGDNMAKENIDYIVLPREMPQYIFEYITFYTNSTKETIEAERTILFSILKQATEVDFTFYKQASILRRIQRRMANLGFHSLQEYNRFLNDNADEIAALQKDFLIGVTHFFRDPDAFAIIAEKVIPAIFEQCAPQKQIRVWVAGCSTGEEVYTLAILFRLYMRDIEEDYEVKIFATDLDKDSIQFASKGIYSEVIAKSINPEQLKAYFTLIGSEYQVNKEIREMVVFAQHNILKDPPFIQIDLVTCRNMLIYLQPEMQKKVISLFHFALKTEAFLFLGPSETLGKLANLFKPLDNKWNIYQYKEMNQWLSTNSFGMGDNVNEKKLNHKNKVNARLKETERMIKLDNIYTKLIEEYVSACVIIDENNEIIHINGNASKYLIIPKGKPSHSLFRMIPEYLAVPVGTALFKVRKEHKEVIYRDIIIRDGSRIFSLNLITKPFHVHSANDKLTIIFFEENTERIERASDTNIENMREHEYFNMDSNINQHIKDLEHELFHAKETLQATIEELETSNEEFQASNEELIVANEELQSTNEELQSVNEELMAVNSEYQYKIQELTELNNDMSNFFISTSIATLFLDTNMNIRKYTPAIVKEIYLMDSDIGRPLGDIAHNLKYERLVVDAKNVLLTATAFEKEIQSKNDKWFRVKMLPYLTVDHLVEGIVITFTDISELKKASEELLILSYAIQQSPGCVVITDLERTIKYINIKYSEHTGYALNELANTKLELHSELLSSEQVQEIWGQVEMGKKWVGEMVIKKKNGESNCELVSLLPIINNEGKINHILKISEDITEQKHTIELLHKSEMLSVVGQLAAGIAHEIRNPLTALKGFTKLLEPNTEKKNYIQIMSSELDRIETIISELLMLARPKKLHFEKKDVMVILEDVIMLLDTQAILSNVEIVTKFVGTIPLVNCIENQLKQVFINILKNGIEAMPEGGNLIVKVKQVEDNHVLISFIDHGIGIPENKVPKLGTPFYTTKENGTGLGLMVSYKIIENHRGSIIIKSTLGKGSAVDIMLKAAKTGEMLK